MTAQCPPATPHPWVVQCSCIPYNAPFRRLLPESAASAESVIDFSIAPPDRPLANDSSPADNKNMKKTLLLSPLAALLLLLAGCSGDDGSDSPAQTQSDAPDTQARPPASDEEALILSIVLANVEALESEDIDGAMSTVDPESAAYASTRDFTASIFELYDLSYEMSELNVTSRSDTEASVHFVQVTRKLSGPDFRDNRVEGEHTLRKVGGVWLISDSRIDSIDYLD
jgi:hypothetical protein